MERSLPVALSAVCEYDADLLLSELKKQFSALGITKEEIEGRRVALKPNLLLGYAPEKCTTTHPALVEAAGRLMKEWGASSVTLVESPGGPYHLGALKSVYRSCGMDGAAERGGFDLNEDLSAVDLHFPEGVKSKMFHVLKPLYDAEVIVNLCKLKTHSLATMTCAVKNLFGAIPGIEKFETHSRFPEVDDFFGMLTDLCLALCEGRSVISVVDAVMGMEGEGPSGGTPRKFGFIGTSRSPFCLDLACAKIMGLEGEVQMIGMANRRGLCPDRADELVYPLENTAPFEVSDVKRPQTSMKKKFDLVPKFMQPRPEIDRSVCVGCGQCVRSCPQHTIALVDKKAKIDRKNCIRCYCCQELCTFKAVKIHKNWILRLIQK